MSKFRFHFTSKNCALTTISVDDILSRPYISSTLSVEEKQDIRNWAVKVNKESVYKNENFTIIVSEIQKGGSFTSFPPRATRKEF